MLTSDKLVNNYRYTGDLIVILHLKKIELSIVKAFEAPTFYNIFTIFYNECGVQYFKEILTS